MCVVDDLGASLSYPLMWCGSLLLLTSIAHSTPRQSKAIIQNWTVCAVMCWEMFNHQLQGGALANVRGVNISTSADFKPPLWSHWAQSWEEMCAISFQEPIRGTLHNPHPSCTVRLLGVPSLTLQTSGYPVGLVCNARVKFGTLLFMSCLESQKPSYRISIKVQEREPGRNPSTHFPVCEME